MNKTLEKQLLTIVNVIKTMQKKIDNAVSYDKEIKELKALIENVKDNTSLKENLKTIEKDKVDKNYLDKIVNTLKDELKDLKSIIPPSIDVESKLKDLIKDYATKNELTEILKEVKTEKVVEQITTKPLDIKAGKVKTVDAGNDASVEIRKIKDTYYIDFLIPRGVSGRGQPGKDGESGIGVPTGGTTNQILVKKTNNDYDTEWKDPSASSQIQSDYAQTDNTKVDFIKNKPTIPTKTSDLINDSNFVDDISGKQDVLVSGTNIKTINSTSLLGSGNIDIGGSYTLPTATDTILGGIKVGARLSISSGVLSADVQTTDISGKVDKVAGKSLVDDTAITDLTDGGTTILHKHSYNNLDDKPTIPTEYTDEMAQDAVGGMFTGNTETGITATYNDSTAKIDLVVASQTDNNFTNTLKTKLDGIADNANNYTHPANHSPSIITQDASNRFVSDTEKATWNSKANALGADDNYVTDAEKTKLGYITVTQAVNLDTMESDITTNNAKVGVTTQISNLVEDTTPQLGGNLDLNAKTVGDATASDLTKLHALTASSTELNYVDGVTSAIQTQLDGKVNLNGWIAGLGTWTYSSADSPTFVISINADATGLIGVGDRIKLTQTTDKYFIVTAVGTFSGGNTLITVYGGTDYTLANTTITNPYYSHVKSPFGFPLNKSKWSVVVSSTSDFTQATSGTNIYNLGSCNISIPIGLWKVSMKILPQLGIGGTTAVSKYLTVSLSTTSNTLDPANAIGIAGGDVKFIRNYIEKTIDNLSLSSKTTYYLTGRDDGGSGSTIYILGATSTTYLIAECAYL